MILLKIEHFSCIERAEFQVGTINVLIGPQASGKSVISKLLYFFLNLIDDQYEKISQERSFDHFLQEVKVRFCEWFPVSAWGTRKFRISFEAGEYKCKLTRTSYNDSISNNLRLWTSPLVEEHYRETLDTLRAAKSKSTPSVRRGGYDQFELQWKIQASARRKLGEALNSDFVEAQTFIPAGRSFFTNLGRAFLAFDQGRMLDPITVRFGRLYSTLIQESNFLFDEPSRLKGLAGELSEILGGELHWEGERVSVVCPDGRRIPFPSLSSGQQELLPLLLTFQWAHRYGAGRKEIGNTVTYIEEPEAHLFPSAQSRVIQALATFAMEQPEYRRLILTTHSPYVLSKINNLIKAGDLETRLSKSRQTLLNRLVPKRARIRANSIKAYALVSGKLESIIDADGLIAGDYLDSISNEISVEFSKLLELEFS